MGSIIKGVTAKTSPNDFFASKMIIYTFVGRFCVSNVKANIRGEKWMPKLCLIHFSPGILAFALETKTMTKYVYKACFEVRNSFAVTPFNCILGENTLEIFCKKSV